MDSQTDLKAGIGEEIDGFHMETLKAGDATNYPKPGTTVRVHYICKFENGNIIDSSREKRRPFLFKVGDNQVIEGWEIAIAKMSKGQTAKVALDAPLAYGEAGYPPIIPPNTKLIYEIELLGFWTPPVKVIEEEEEVRLF